MSETEYHYGKLKLVPKLENETLEEQCKRLSVFDELPDPDYYETWEEYFRDMINDKYIISNNNIYELYDHFGSDDYEYFKIIPNSNGTLTFIGNFYNGGTCLQECLEEELEKLNNDTK